MWAVWGVYAIRCAVRQVRAPCSNEISIPMTQEIAISGNKRHNHGWLETSLGSMLLHTKDQSEQIDFRLIRPSTVVLAQSCVISLSRSHRSSAIHPPTTPRL